MTKAKPSAFKAAGLKKAIADLMNDIREAYTSDDIPWVVGYSGGKDSTATLQLVWLAIASLPRDQRHKTIYVISTDTLVENPIVAKWMVNSHNFMKSAAEQDALPIEPRILEPRTEDTFWVNLIGRGYPAPKQKFRWCTERLKIKASNLFIRDVVKSNGEAIVILGTRRAESASRAQVMNKYKENRVRNRFSPNPTLPNSLIFSPIEDWSNDDVWLFLLQYTNPWGIPNKDLLSMYRGASEDNECPLVVDTGTPSCGSSRFGCWVCTLVDKDRSMQAMIKNDDEKKWMHPLLKLRDKLGNRDDRDLRDFRRMHGQITLFNDRLIHGPYTRDSREMWLRELLKIQKWIQTNGPKEFHDYELITLSELREIRRIWVTEKHEIEDRLPLIYFEELDLEYPEKGGYDSLPFSPEELEMLSGACNNHQLKYELIRELIDIENSFKTMTRRSGLLGTLEKAFLRSFYDDDNDAQDKAQRRQAALDAADDGEYQQLSLFHNSSPPSPERQ